MTISIRAPSQRRSQRTMDEIFRALELLLKRRGFDRITITDLANEAGVAVGSIYARFRDKNALLTGLYIGVATDAKTGLQRLSSAERWEGVTTERMIRSVVVATIRFYRLNAPVLRAATIADLADVAEMRVVVWMTAIDRFTELLAERAPAADVQKLNLAVRVIVRFFTALVHQSVLVGGFLTRWDGAISNRELIQQMSQFATDIVARAEAAA
jgi:AcrR family transcriptional regulator